MSPNTDTAAIEARAQHHLVRTDVQRDSLFKIVLCNWVCEKRF